MSLACASRRCRPHGATAPRARAGSASGSGCRATCIGTGAGWPEDSATADRMSRVNRVIYALPILVGTLFPLSVVAAPNPSPSLAQILVAPPSGFTQITAATLHGKFSAETFGTTYGTQAGTAANALTHDGFVDGYGVTWYQASTGHAMVEFVIAFEGGKGARSWLLYEQASDKNEKHYQHDDSIAGIDPYYGVHLIDSSVMVVGDAFSFVKGNDMFGIGFL